jgi:hypothetical protein
MRQKITSSRWGRSILLTADTVTISIILICSVSRHLVSSCVNTPMIAKECLQRIEIDSARMLRVDYMLAM